MKQQINGLPDKVASQQLNSQVDELKKQIDTLPDQITSKEQITLQKDRLVLEKDRVNAQNAIYGTLIQTVGGVFFFVTAYFTWRNVKAAEEKQVTERFSKAVEQLGNDDNIHVRLGGIYALERIANDSDKDYWQVIEVLTAYIREKSPLPPATKEGAKPAEEQKKDIPPIPTDIQAALTVLARRRYAFEKGEKYHLDLNRTNLQGARLRGANLQGAYFGRANLQRAHLDEAKLQKAFLWRANLREAELKGTNLQGAELKGAILKDVMNLHSVIGLTRKQINQIDQAQSNIDKSMLPDYLRTDESSQPQPPDPQQT